MANRHAPVWFCIWTIALFMLGEGGRSAQVSFRAPTNSSNHPKPPLPPPARNKIKTFRSAKWAGKRRSDEEPTNSTTIDVHALGMNPGGAAHRDIPGNIAYAVEKGYMHFELPVPFEKEIMTGKGGLLDSAPDRGGVWITARLPRTRQIPQGFEATIRESLANSSLKYLDLYIMSRAAVAPGPGDTYQLDKGNLATLWRAMEDLVMKGYTRAIGISDFAKEEFRDILCVCKICPYAHEIKTSSRHQQRVLLAWHAKMQTNVIASLYEEDELWKYDMFWTELANRKQTTKRRAMLAWHINRGTIILPEAQNRAEMDDNLGAMDIHYTDAEMEEIEKRDTQTYEDWEEPSLVGCRMPGGSR